MQLARITVYPVKSLNGVELKSATLLENGALAWDRRFALHDDAGVVNGKREPLLHGISARFDLEAPEIALKVNGFPEWERFELRTDNAALNDWYGSYFGYPVQLAEYPHGGLPDDKDYPGPTLISRQSIVAVAAWFDGVSEASMRQRLRANLELEAHSAFAEDALLNPENSAFRFRLGKVGFTATHPCQRCVVPGRDPHSGTEIDGFAAIFRQRRQQSLAGHRAAHRFDHFYRLSLNTRVAAGQAGRQLNLGDMLEITP